MKGMVEDRTSMAGKIVLISTNVVSKDGQTMTITTKGVNADGQSVNNVRVYDKVAKP